MRLLYINPGATTLSSRFASISSAYYVLCSSIPCLVCQKKRNGVIVVPSNPNAVMKYDAVGMMLGRSIAFNTCRQSGFDRNPAIMYAININERKKRYCSITRWSLNKMTYHTKTEIGMTHQTNDVPVASPSASAIPAKSAPHVAVLVIIKMTDALIANRGG